MVELGEDVLVGRGSRLGGLGRRASSEAELQRARERERERESARERERERGRARERESARESARERECESERRRGGGGERRRRACTPALNMKSEMVPTLVTSGIISIRAFLRASASLAIWYPWSRFSICTARVAQHSDGGWHTSDDGWHSTAPVAGAGWSRHRRLGSGARRTWPVTEGALRSNPNAPPCVWRRGGLARLSLHDCAESLLALLPLPRCHPLPHHRLPPRHPHALALASVPACPRRSRRER